MAEELNFTQNSQGKWETTFTSSGDRMAVEVERTNSGSLIIYGRIEDMEKRFIHDFGPGANRAMIFEIDVPADIDITILSYTEVTSAKIVGV